MSKNPCRAKAASVPVVTDTSEIGRLNYSEEQINKILQTLGVDHATLMTMSISQVRVLSSARASRALRAPHD
jgi:hypothetical protein